MSASAQFGRSRRRRALAPDSGPPGSQNSLAPAVASRVTRFVSSHWPASEDMRLLQGGMATSPTPDLIEEQIPDRERKDSPPLHCWGRRAGGDIFL